MKNKILLILLLIFAVALFLRLYQLGTNPEALNWDEAALGYNSYSLLKTAKDEYGHKLPLLLRSYDDYKPAIYSYFSIPFIYIWGLNIASTRFVSAFFGALMVFSMYIFVRNIFSSKRAGIIAALFTSVAPVFLFYSRIAMEANLSLSIFTFGLALITYKKNLKKFILGALFLILSAYTYYSARYLVPIVIFVATLQLKSLPLRKKMLLLSLCGLLYLPIIYYTLSPLYNSRFGRVFLFSDPSRLTGYNIKVSDLSILPRGITKAYYYLLDITGRYLSYFNPFVIFSKSPSNDSYTVRDIGTFNLFELPFCLVGVYYYLKKIKKFNSVFWATLIFGALPAALTIDWLTPLRATLLWPFYIGLSAYGVVKIIDFKTIKTRSFLLFNFLGWVFYAAFILEIVFVYRNYAYYGYYQYGFAQSVPYVNKLISQEKYDSVVIDSPHGQPHMFYLFFSAYPPEVYQKETAWRDTDYSIRTNFDFGPYTFRDIYWPKDRQLKNTLFIGDLSSLPTDQIENTQGAKILKDFYTPDNNVAFRVVEKD